MRSAPEHVLGRHEPHRDPEEDVESYAVARWVDAVRTLVELGAGVEEAEVAARTALTRSWRAWKREQRVGDVDVLVFGELLRAWGWPHARPQVGADQVARVLVAEGRLSDHAAQSVTGGSPDGAPLETRGLDGPGAYRGAAPIAEVRDDLRRRRRRTASLLTVATAVTAVVVGLVLVLTAPTPPEPRPVVVNRLPLAWWSQDTLHLAGSELSVPGLVELAQVGRGASYAVVFGDERGRVFQVDDLSDPVRVGSTEPGSAIGAAPDGRAAWVDVSEPVPTVVVWDAAAQEVVHRLRLSDDASSRETDVAALDGDAVYLSSPNGTSRWVLGEATARPFPDRVVDASGGVLVVAMPPAGTGGSVLTSSGRFRVAADHQATLSPGGLIAATWVPDEPGLALNGVGATLTTVPLRLPQRAGIVEARFAPNGDLVLVLSRRIDGPVTLTTCVLQTGSCEEVYEVGSVDSASQTTSRAPVVLAH